MLRFAALAVALTVLAPDAARAVAIIEIDLVSGYPLADLGIEVSAVAPATITAMDERDVLLLPIASGGGAPGSTFSLSFLGGLQLSREGATATITAIEMMLSALLPEEFTIAGTARLALDGIDQAVIQLDLAYCDQRVGGFGGGCYDDDLSPIATGVRVALADLDAIKVFDHLGAEPIVPQLGIWDGEIRLQVPEPSLALLFAAVLAGLVPLRRAATRRSAR